MADTCAGLGRGKPRPYIREIAVGSAENNLGRAGLLLGIQYGMNGCLGGSPAVIPRTVEEHHVLGGFLKLGNEIKHAVVYVVLDSIAERYSIGQHARSVRALPPEHIGGQLLFMGGR